MNPQPPHQEPPLASTMPSHPDRGVRFGALGVLGLLLNWKVGLHEVVEPFAHCHDAQSILAVLDRLPETMFLGLVTWSLLLVSSLAGVWIFAQRTAGSARLLARERRHRILESRATARPTPPPAMKHGHSRPERP